MNTLTDAVYGSFFMAVDDVAHQRGIAYERELRKSITPATTIADLNDAAVAYFKQEAEDHATDLFRGFSADSFYHAWNVTEPRAQLATLLEKQGWTLQEL